MAVRMTRGVVRTNVRFHFYDPAGGLLSPAADIADEDLSQ